MRRGDHGRAGSITGLDDPCSPGAGVAKVVETGAGWQKQLADSRQLNEGRMSQANTILKYRPDLADDVTAGTLPLNDAYAQAKARKEGKDADEVRMAELR